MWCTCHEDSPAPLAGFHGSAGSHCSHFRNHWISFKIHEGIGVGSCLYSFFTWQGLNTRGGTECLAFLHFVTAP